MLSNAVLELTTGFLQVSLELLVFLLQLADVLGTLLPATSLLHPLGQRVWKQWEVEVITFFIYLFFFKWTLLYGIEFRIEAKESIAYFAFWRFLFLAVAAFPLTHD